MSKNQMLKNLNEAQGEIQPIFEYLEDQMANLTISIDDIKDYYDPEKDYEEPNELKLKDHGKENIQDAFNINIKKRSRDLTFEQFLEQKNKAQAENILKKLNQPNHPAHLLSRLLINPDDPKMSAFIDDLSLYLSAEALGADEVYNLHIKSTFSKIKSKVTSSDWGKKVGNQIPGFIKTPASGVAKIAGMMTGGDDPETIMLNKMKESGLFPEDIYDHEEFLKRCKELVLKIKEKNPDLAAGLDAPGDFKYKAIKVLVTIVVIVVSVTTILSLMGTGLGLLGYAGIGAKFTAVGSLSVNGLFPSLHWTSMLNYGFGSAMVFLKDSTLAFITSKGFVIPGWLFSMVSSMILVPFLKHGLTEVKKKMGDKLDRDHNIRDLVKQAMVAELKGLMGDGKQRAELLAGKKIELKDKGLIAAQEEYKKAKDALKKVGNNNNDQAKKDAKTRFEVAKKNLIEANDKYEAFKRYKKQISDPKPNKEGLGISEVKDKVVERRKNDHLIMHAIKKVDELYQEINDPKADPAEVLKQNIANMEKRKALTEKLEQVLPDIGISDLNDLSNDVKDGLLNTKKQKVVAGELRTALFEDLKSGTYKKVWDLLNIGDINNQNNIIAYDKDQFNDLVKKNPNSKEFLDNFAKTVALHNNLARVVDPALKNKEKDKGGILSKFSPFGK